MKNGDQPINYCMMQQVGDTSFRANRFNDPKEYNRPMIGLTKREYFAALAMQSYAGGEYIGQRGMPHEMIAEWSVKMAEALLKELEK
jgi:hypothetical protein